MTKYKCGHNSDTIIANNSILMLSTYLTWKDTDGFDGDKSKCFDCYLKTTNKVIKIENRICEKNKLLIKVTVDKFYYVPEAINGWDEKTIIADWFKDTPPYNYHATRNGHHIGHCDKIKKIEVLKRGNFKEFDNEILK